MIKIRTSLLFLPIFLISGCAKQPLDQWRCTSTNLNHEHWIKHAPTREEAAIKADDACRVGAYRSTCRVKCMPPNTRWHCVATDKGGHTWYWNSTSIKVAVRNATDECKKNTTQGGCVVLMKNCSMT